MIAWLKNVAKILTPNPPAPDHEPTRETYWLELTTAARNAEHNMNEQEWLASNDPAAMLSWWQGEDLHGHRLYPRSDRKLRLFACACCRQVWHLLTDPRSRRAVEVAERYADGLATREELTAAAAPAWSAVPNGPDFSGEDIVGAAVSSNLQRSLTYLVTSFVEWVPPAAQAALLRDIVGNPWRPMPLLTKTVYCDRCNGKGQRTLGVKCGSCDGSGKTRGNADWLTPTVVSLAAAAYECRVEPRPCGNCNGTGGLIVEGGPWINCTTCHGTGRSDDGTLDNDRLAILADALEEAGCAADERCEACKGDGRYEWWDKSNARLTWAHCGMCAGAGRVPNPIITHLRGKVIGDWRDERGNGGLVTEPAAHCRGCWALDLVLGKD